MIPAPTFAAFDPPLTPALVLDLDAVAHNIRAMVARAGGPDRWRPHLKTVKHAAIVELLLAAGVRGFKVATLPELTLALDAARSIGEPIDVLVAYPLRGAALDTLGALAAGHRRHRIGVLADDPAHLAEVRRLRGVRVHLDVDLGMGRTGTPPEDWAGVDSAGVHGLHGYDGHLGWDDREAAHAGYHRLCDLAYALGGAGLDLVTSGTHSYAHALAHERLQAGPWRAQVSPGTVVLSDLRTAPAVADLGLRQAAWVATRAVSVRGDRVTLDAGSKALSPDAHPAGAVVDHPELDWLTASEEHQPCRGRGPTAGERVWVVPTHVCTTVNLYREAWLARDGRVEQRSQIGAAGRQLSV
ncbi:MAG: D-serine deaminase-like pyridoxal phosphate-dependent protein [Myxococcota bacterium]|jgi:D-serine deaminase-like pyridoxal phosphate-dependent protein